MADWDDFGFEDAVETYEVDLSNVPTADLENELARRREQSAETAITEDSTLREARAFMEARKVKGCDCFLCGRHSKRYPRLLRKDFAAVLRWVHEATMEGQWVDMSQDAPKWVMSKVRDFTLLRHWGLLEARTNTDTRKKGSGFWRITAKGRQWVRGEISVSSKFYEYQGRLVGWSDEHVSCHDVLPEFDFKKLMEEA